MQQREGSHDGSSSLEIMLQVQLWLCVVMFDTVVSQLLKDSLCYPGRWWRWSQDKCQRESGEAEDSGETPQPQTGVNAGSRFALWWVVVFDFLLLTPPTALPWSGDFEVQPMAPESAAEPKENRSAAQHSGGQRPNWLHLGPPRTLRSSSSIWHLWNLVSTHNSTRQAGRLITLFLAASALSTTVYIICSSPSPPSSSSTATSSSHVTSSLWGPAKWGERVRHPSAAGFTRDWNVFLATGSIFTSILRQQSAADSEEEAEEDCLSRLITVEERWEEMFI